MNKISQLTAQIGEDDFEWNESKDLDVEGMDASFKSVARYVSANAYTRQDIELKKLLFAIQV